MRTVAIIQARMGSKRLPGKVLMDLGGKPVLQWVIDATLAIRGIAYACVATPDDEIAHWCGKRNIRYQMGSESDVLGRYMLAAQAEHADVIVRLTADCPLLSRKVIADVIALRHSANVAYASNVDPPTWPDGFDCEAFTIDALRMANVFATSPYDREHVTPYMRANFNRRNLVNPVGDQSQIKLSIDTLQDLENVRRKIASAA